MEYKLYLKYWDITQAVKFLKDMNIEMVVSTCDHKGFSTLCFNCRKKEYQKLNELLQRQKQIVEILDAEVEDNGDLLRLIWNFRVVKAFKHLEDIEYSVDDYRPLVEDSVLDLYEIAHYCLKYHDNLGWEELEDLVK